MTLSVKNKNHSPLRIKSSDVLIDSQFNLQVIRLSSVNEELTKDQLIASEAFHFIGLALNLLTQKRLFPEGTQNRILEHLEPIDSWCNGISLPPVVVEFFTRLIHLVKTNQDYNWCKRDFHISSNVWEGLFLDVPALWRIEKIK